MKFRKIVKKTAIIAALLVLVTVIYIALGTTLPYIKHREPSSETADAFNGADFTGDGSQGERIRNITDNTEALIYRLKLISEAKTEIKMATFEFFDDESGRDILCALWKAAERGVKVQLLLDGYNGEKLTKSPYLRLLAAHENARVKLYNVLNPFLPWKAQSRMHEKYMICDYDVYLLGGRNTNNRFLGRYPTDIVSQDRELLVTADPLSDAPSVVALHDYFEDYFDHPDCTAFTCSTPDIIGEASDRYESLREKYSDAFAQTDLRELTYPVNKVTLISGSTVTGNKSPDVWYQLTGLMRTGSEVIIQSPYIMCSSQMYSDLKDIAGERDVTLFINSPLTGSNVFGGADYISEKAKVMSTGMTVYEYTSEMPFHTKTILIDGNISIIGSFNLDMRSTYIDSELMLVVDSKELNSEIRTELEVIKDASIGILPEGDTVKGENYFEPEKTFSENVKSFLVRVFTRPIRFLL